MKSHDKESAGSVVADSVETMVRLPLQVTEATMEAVVQGVRWMTGTSQAPMTEVRLGPSDGKAAANKSDNGSTASTSMPGGSDLSGDDLKYVVWSIVFTKPGFEAVLVSQSDDLVGYSADPSTYAAGKIVRFLEKARDGQVAQPEGWAADKHTEMRDRPARGASASGESRQGATSDTWRIQPEDEKYLVFLYRVERRLPKPEPEVVRTEHVTIEAQRV